MFYVDVCKKYNYLSETHDLPMISKNLIIDRSSSEPLLTLTHYWLDFVYLNHCGIIKVLQNYI